MKSVTKINKNTWKLKYSNNLKLQQKANIYENVTFN